MNPGRQRRRPNLFLLGAPRCGTAAMFQFLGAHPEIQASRVKETRFFTPELNERSLDEYLELFAGASDERWLLEATPAYLSTPGAPERIRDFSPESRAIVMVRDPVEQIRSLHDLRVFRHREHSRDLAAELAFDDAEERYWNLVRNGEHVARLLEVFPREDVHVVVHDDFGADNAATYRRVLEFLDVDPSFAPQFRIVNPSSAPRNATLQKALWHEGGAVRAVARATLPARLRKRAFGRAAQMNRRPHAGNRVDPWLASEIWSQIEPDVERLGTLLDRDLVALWRR